MSHRMRILILLPRAAASAAFAYILFILWMGAGILAVLVFAALLHGGLNLARHGDRPLEDWPILRHILARHRPGA